jgi:hypothetical protein
MKTIELTAVVGPDRKLIVQLPADIAPGEHRVVVVIETPGARSTPMAGWPAHDVGPWPEDLSLRREDMYGDGGR